jgi:hypothetical protein
MNRRLRAPRHDHAAIGRARDDAIGSCHTFGIFPRPVKAKPQVCEWLAWAKLCEAEELRRPRCQKATLNHFYMFGPSEPQFHR